MSALPVKRRKIQIVLEDAQEDAEKIVEQVRKSSRNMVNLLSGFLGKEAKGKYDSLTNLSAIAGKGNEYNAYIEGMNEAVQQFQTLAKLLDDIETMEEGR